MNFKNQLARSAIASSGSIERMISGIAIATIAILLAVVLRIDRFSRLRPLVVPLIITSLAALSRSAALFFSAEPALDRWSLIFLVLAVGFLASKTGLTLLFDWGLERRMGISVPQLIRDVTAIGLYLTVAVFLLNTLGVKVTGLIATSAVLTVVVGLAFQQTLGNLLAGLALAWEQRLPTGSWIDFNSQVVRIEETGWRSILLRTKLGDRILVPNADIAAAQIIMLSGGGRPVAVQITLGLSYSVSPDHAKRVLFDVAKDIPLVLGDPEPKILTVEFGDSSIVYECRLWTRAPWQRNEMTDTFLTRTYAALARHGMEIPFPQLTLHQSIPTPTTDLHIRRLEALVGARLFAGLPEEALDTIARHCSLQRFASGEAIVHQGDESNALFVVVSGEAVVRQNGQDVSQIGPSEVFGEGAFLTGNPRSATVRAGGGPLEILEISKSSLASLFEHHPELTEKLAERLAERQLEGETMRDASGAVVHPQGLVAQIKRTLSRLVGG